jgi:putative hydrolase of the HAD superfamily
VQNIKVIAWDFDGVLNRSIVNGRFIWADRFEQDIGHSRAGFEDHIFHNNLDAIITGKEDLRDRVADWANMVGYAHGADRILDYWFRKDAFPDPEMLVLMDRIAHCGLRQIITTNNETRRTTYIETELGFGARVERVFASGRMGLAKPDPLYFETVAAQMNVDPAQIFLIDDTVENITAAKRLGWQGLHFTDKTRHALETMLPI